MPIGSESDEEEWSGGENRVPGSVATRVTTPDFVGFFCLRRARFPSASRVSLEPLVPAHNHC